MIAVRFRDSLPTVVADEFDSLIAQLKAWALVSHDESGNQIVGDRTLDFVPVGTINPYAAATPPSGWKICNGDALNRVDYKGLFDVIGTTWGAGDGSTTFNIPDLRGKFVLGQAAAGTGSSIASTGGSIDHTHGAGSFAGTAHTHAAGTLAGPSHTHGAGTLAGPSHTHGVGTLTMGTPDDCQVVNAGAGTAWDLATCSHGHDLSGSTASGGTGAVTGSTAAGGTGAVTGSTASDGGGTISGTSGTANPPFAAMPFIIFTGRA